MVWDLPVGPSVPDSKLKPVSAALDTLPFPPALHFGFSGPADPMLQPQSFAQYAEPNFLSGGRQRGNRYRR